MRDLQGGEPSGQPSDARSVIDDCWNRIGVRGDASCPELRQHVHCRNCPVYSAAALTLLDRDLPADYLSAWTGHFARGRQVQEADTHSAIIFRIGSEWFALPTLLFDEVAEQRPIHSLPHRRGGTVLGLVNVRGELLICVSLGKLLGLGDAALPTPDQDGIARRRLVVIRYEGGRVAFPVDEVHSTHRYHPHELKAVPATVVKAASAHTKAVLSWQDKTVGYLDDQLLVHTLNRSVA